jgi:hypothetical protein
LSNIGLTRQLNNQFAEAIYTYDDVLNVTECEVTELVTELHQAFSYYMLSESNTRRMPEVSRRQPTSLEDFLEIQDEILYRLNNLNRSGSNPKPDPEPDFEFASDNFPNPFNPETTISFTLSNVENVEITVFNVRGQIVRRLVNDSFERGHHRVVWDGRDDSGRQVSSGIYFYKIDAGEHTAVRRMLLMK